MSVTLSAMPHLDRGALPHQITDTRPALDRHTARLQIGDIAVDRALGHLEPFAEFLGGDQATAAQMLDDQKEPIDATGARLGFPRLPSAGGRRGPERLG